MIVVAHRGNSSVAPENTLAAVEAAIRSGATGIEIDVQLTADRVPVVIHDDVLDRTTDGSGPVAATRSDVICGLDAGSWFGQQFAGERVPMLEDVLDRLSRADGVHLLLEVKGAWAVEDVGLVTEAIEKRALADRVVAQSFSAATVAALGTVAPRLRRGLLVTEAHDRVLELCRELGATACNPRGDVLRARPELVGQAHAAGITVTPWTLNEPEQWAAATGLGVDGIITDRPDQLLAWQSSG
ncbi:glycerophosphodiester phosphodiesterase [Georgenia sp. H159]|uniref:glycerophosphodiester phosphodiesterase n=1 Tax=Georgenia sp. H159 TaxID=3076115 RepID=UPI002D789AC5|nr:glycerophosphodiester phosphodiesterase family protein [Georgenia sp. H159]